MFVCVSDCMCSFSVGSGNGIKPAVSVFALVSFDIPASLSNVSVSFVLTLGIEYPDLRLRNVVFPLQTLPKRLIYSPFRRKKSLKSKTKSYSNQVHDSRNATQFTIVNVYRFALFARRAVSFKVSCKHISLKDQ